MREPDQNPKSNQSQDADRKLRDVLLESMLPEAVDAIAPPDLRDRIASELRAPNSEPELVRDAAWAGAATTSRRTLIQRVALAAAAGFLLAFFGLLVFASNGPRVANVRVTVVQGEPTYVMAKQPQEPRPFATNADTDIQLAVGDRFTTHAGSGAVLHLQPLGILTLSDHSTVEIVSMNWTKRDSGLVLASLTIGAVAGAFTWNSIVGEPVEAGDSQTMVAKGSDDDSDDLVDSLRGQIASLKKQNEDLKDGMARHKIAEKKPVPEEPDPDQKTPDPTAKPDIVALFADPEFGDALKDIDWQKLGVNMQKMTPMISKLAESIANGEDVPLDVAGELQKLNGDLVVIAKAIMDAKIPGSGINGSFTHPSVAANQIGAVLQAAGLKLNDDQQQGMERLRTYYAAKDKSLRLNAGNRDLELENLLDEVDYKDAFYKEARAMLTPEQRNALSSGASRGRAQLDMFDTGLVLAQYARPARVKDAADLAANWKRRLSADLKLDAVGKTALDGILTAYANKFPASTWENEPDALDRKRMMKSSRVREALRLQVAMMREIQKKMSLSDEQLADIKKAMFVLVPYKK